MKAALLNALQAARAAKTPVALVTALHTTRSGRHFLNQWTASLKRRCRP